MGQMAYVWQDRDGNNYCLQNINDRYLLNILRFISKGGGSIDFLSDSIIEQLYNEANKRKLKHNLKLEYLISRFHEKINDWANAPDFWS